MSIPPEVIYGVALLALAAGLLYGGVSYVTRDKRKDSRTEAATRKLYDQPTRDDAEQKHS